MDVWEIVRKGYREIFFFFAAKWGYNGLNQHILGVLGSLFVLTVGDREGFRRLAMKSHGYIDIQRFTLL